VIRSTNGGTSWTTTFVDTSEQQPPCNVPSCSPDFFASQAGIGVDTAGKLMVAYTLNTTAAAPKDLYVKTSTDAGLTWSARTEIGQNTGDAGFPVIEFSLLNRTFVLPFLLVAINLFLRRRYVLAFLVAGLMYNLHVISVQFVLAMFLLDAVVELKSIGWRRLGASLAVFLVAALPVLVWKLTGTPVDFSVRTEWFQTIARGTLFNLFYLFPPFAYILVMTLSGFSALALFVVARHGQPPTQQHRTVNVFIAACLIVLAVQVLTAQFAPITIIVQSQIIRAGAFI